MDRQKKINEAAIKAYPPIPEELPFGSFLREYNEYLRKAFIKGARWSDDHPYVDFVVRSRYIEDLNPDD